MSREFTKGELLMARAGRVMVGLVAATSFVVGACSSTETATTDTSSADGGQVAASGARYGGPVDGANPQAGGTVVMGIEGEPEALDPSRYAFSSSGHYVASAVYEPIAALGEDGQPVPYLVEDIQPNDDYTEWTFTVPTGVTFHDGTPMDADSIARNLKVHQNALVTKLSMKPVISVEATDATHVVVKLDRPWVSFPTLMTSQAGYIVQPDVLEQAKVGESPIGTGPFKFDSHVKGERWTFTRFDDYRRSDEQGTQLPYLQEIEFRPIPDDAKRLLELEDGTLNLMHTVSPEQVLRLEASDYKRVSYDLGEENFLVMNMEKPPFDNIKARQALVYASDSAGYLEDIALGSAQPANSPFAPGQIGYVEDNGYPAFDMDKAKQLVSEYEQETGKELSFTYVTVDDPRNIRTAQYFTDLYKQAGMTVELKGVPQINLVAQVATGSYQLSVFRNFGFPNPDTDTVFWRPESVIPDGVSLNFPRFTDERVQTLLDQAIAETDEAERDRLYQEVNKIWAEQLPYVWFGRQTWVLAANPNVNGIRPAGNGSISTLGAKVWIGDLWVKQ